MLGELYNPGPSKRTLESSASNEKAIGEGLIFPRRHLVPLTLLTSALFNTLSATVSGSFHCDMLMDGCDAML